MGVAISGAIMFDKVNPFIKCVSLFYVYFLFTLLKQSNLNENS